MNLDELVFAWSTPARRFPAKAIDLCTQSPELGRAVARAVLLPLLEDAKAGAEPRFLPKQEDQEDDAPEYYDPATSHGAVHACFVLGWHGDTEDQDLADAVLSLDEAQLAALLGDCAPIVLPQLLRVLPDDALLGRSDVAFPVEAALQDEVLRRAYEGPLSLDGAREELKRYLKAAEGAEDQHRYNLALLGLLAVCDQSHRAELEGYYNAPLGDGTLRDADFDALAKSTDDIAKDIPQHLQLLDPREVEHVADFGWEKPAKVAKKKPRKKVKKKKPKGKKR